jgi:hypothetical protein
LDELAALAAGSFFQTSAWLAAVHAAEPRLRPRVLVVEDEAGELRAACPLLVAFSWGVRRLYAGAWGTYGGILARDPAAAAVARGALEGLARAPRTALSRVHDFSASLPGGDFWTETEESCQVLDLPREPELLFNDAFTMQNRNKIRKAEKRGVVVHRARDRETLARYAALYLESATRWKLAHPLPPAFFRKLANVPGVDVWIADHEGEPIAGLLNFTWGGQVMNWGNVSRREAWSLSPNNLLHWRALQAACSDAAGPRLYNFGGSTGLRGVETFKASFGTRVQRYLRRERIAGWARALVRKDAVREIPVDLGDADA